MAFGGNVSWGIDIGESAIRAVKLKTSKSGAQVVGMDVVRRSVRAEGFSYVEKEAQIRECLATLSSRNDFRGSRVALSIPGAGFDRFISLPAVSMKQVPQIVKYEARQQIPFPLDEVAWDYQLASERPIPGEGIEVALFAIKTQIIEQMLANLSVAKLGVDVIGMSRLALYNVLKYDRALSGGTLIVDVGAGSTDIVIIADDNFRVRSIPICGEAVTKMLQQKFGISYEEAEELKKKASQSKQPEKLFNVMRPTFEKLLGEIHKTVGYYKQQFKTLKIDQAFLVGDSFKMQPLVDLFGESLGCKVSVLSDFQRISLSSELLASPLSSELPSFSVAIGLALQAAGQGPITINVLPEEVRGKREFDRKRPAAIGVAACISVGVLASIWNVSGDTRRLESLSDKPTAAIQRARESANAYRQASDFANINHDIKGLASIGENRTIMVEAINEVARVINDGSREIFIDEIKMETAMVARQPAGFEEGVGGLGETQAVIPTDKVYQMTIKGWTEHNDLVEHVYANFVNKLKQVEIFNAFGRPEGRNHVNVTRREERREEGRKPRLSFELVIIVTPHDEAGGAGL